ncbi:MAG: porin [Paraglaciecola sp.]|uniref:porin n=1 Tax=Paraglaciecola sp. TaxID=1920173 RepID=UPI0032971495
MKKLLTLAVLTASTYAVQAEVRINGFTNFLGGITSSDESLYGYDDKISFSEESLFAIQISGDINDKMTATGQLVARGEDDYKAKFEWAYLTYQATSNLNVSAGRFRLPLFSYSASSEVGYSYHWVTTPQTVYDVSFNNIDGLKLDYSNYFGDWEYVLSSSFGSFSDDTDETITSGDDTVLVSAEAVYDALKIRAVIGRTNLNVDSPSVDAFLDPMRAAGLNSLADSLDIEDDNGTFKGLSIQYDNFDWFIGGEITEISVKDSFAADDVAYYLTAGVRTGKWTPSITYEKFESEAKVKFQDQIDQIATSQLPDSLKETFTGLAIGSQLAQEEDFSTITAAIRYDLDTNIALKADISKRSDDVDSIFDATLLRFAVNYVF